jgi:hypothetical protein
VVVAAAERPWPRLNRWRAAGGPGMLRDLHDLVEEGLEHPRARRVSVGLDGETETPLEEESTDGAGEWAGMASRLAARPGKQDWMAEACDNTLLSRRESVDPSALHPAARTPSRTGNKSAPSEFFSSPFLP